MEFVLTLIYPKSVFAIKSTSYSQESAPAHCDLAVNGGAVHFHRKERILQEKISVDPGSLHLMLCDPLAHLLGDGLDGAILKGNLQPGGLHQLRIAGQTGTAH